MTNFFKLETAPNYMLYQYHVEFVPDVTNMGIRRSLMKEANLQLNSIYIFDGQLLFMPLRLQDQVGLLRVGSFW